MNQKATKIWSLFILVNILGCQAYRQDILFRLDEESAEGLTEAVAKYEGNYLIEENDLIQVDVFTNKGERLIDPNFELQAQGGQQGGQQRVVYQYLVQKGGNVKLPIVGDKTLAGTTIDGAEDILESAYSEFYKEPFVKIQLSNRRVVVLGAGGGAVIPLQNENTNLLEVLALYGGLEAGAKADKIRLLRGDLNNPFVYKIDLSTVAGMQSSIIQIEPGDIIYIEPWRRPWLEGFKDFSPILGLTTSALTLIVVIQNLSTDNSNP
ncbi:MAG: polysaccharide export outer membrane protein [Cyclobacteriaceae bacterium]|jgi:polysaccharide export outer membrane protein